MSSQERKWSVVDLFSGCGGLSYGFAARETFRILAAVDAQEGRPSERNGALDCNGTYAANIGTKPFFYDIEKLDPIQLFNEVRKYACPELQKGDLDVLLCAPPCTDFSKVKPENHLRDSPKNSLVRKCAEFVEAFLPEFVVLENVRELLKGNHSHHYKMFSEKLEKLGYAVHADVYTFTEYGLPQSRERAILIASRRGPVKTLRDLWDGWRVMQDATTVRHAIGRFNRKELAPGEIDAKDPMHRSPNMTSIVKQRIQAIPCDGGSWTDLAKSKRHTRLLIPSMKSKLRKNRSDKKSIGHTDVYGRMAWDRPAVTIKRECHHVGNGRYAHPEQARLLSIREMALLQGFPTTFKFTAGSIHNRYRHIGDAVPPLISYQLSAIVTWMKTGIRPSPRDWVLPKSTLSPRDIRRIK